MCSIMAGLTALGGYMGYRQNKQAADAQAAAYNAQAQAAEQNARVEARKQEQIADNYAQEAKNLRARRRLAEGAQRASTGAAGLSFAGSSMDLLSSSYDAYNQDQLNLLQNQRNDNYASRVAQTNYINQANAARASAANVKSQARNSVFSTILGTAASIYGIEQPWKKSGTSGNAELFDNNLYTNSGNKAVDYYANNGLDTGSASTNLAISGNSGLSYGTNAAVNYYSGNTGWSYNSFNKKKSNLYTKNFQGW